MPDKNPFLNEYATLTAAQLTEQFDQSVDVVQDCATEVADYLYKRGAESKSDLDSKRLRTLVIMADSFRNMLPAVETPIVVMSRYHVDDTLYRCSRDEIADPLHGSFQGALKAYEIAEYEYRDETFYFGLIVKSCVVVGDAKRLITTPVLGSSVHFFSNN